MMAEEGGRTAEDPRMATTAEQKITIVEQDIAAVKREIAAIKHCLIGLNSSNAPEEIRREVLIYEGANKAFLFQFLGNLENKFTALLQNQQTVKSEGNKWLYQIAFVYVISLWISLSNRSCASIFDPLLHLICCLFNDLVKGMPLSIPEDKFGSLENKFTALLQNQQTVKSEGNKWLYQIAFVYVISLWISLSNRSCASIFDPLLYLIYCLCNDSVHGMPLSIADDKFGNLAAILQNQQAIKSEGNN